MPSGNRTLLILIFVVSLLILREVAASLQIYHFQPYAALFFCLAALRKVTLLAIPLVAYFLSTVIAVGGVEPFMLSPLLAFGLIISWGLCFKPKSGAIKLLAGSLGGAAIFYLVTNTISWIAMPEYAKTPSGFFQALWTGLPGFPPTWTFFRNDATATFFFSAIILLLQRFPLPKKAAAPAHLEA